MVKRDARESQFWLEVILIDDLVIVLKRIVHLNLIFILLTSISVLVIHYLFLFHLKTFSIQKFEVTPNLVVFERKRFWSDFDFISCASFSIYLTIIKWKNIVSIKSFYQVIVNQCD